MWNSLAESARKGLTEVLEKTGEALEKTGDAITKAASNPHSNSGSTRRVAEMPRNLESLPLDEDLSNNNDNNSTKKNASTLLGLSMSPLSAGKGSSSSSSGSSLPSPSDIRARAMAALAKVQAKEDAGTLQPHQEESSSSPQTKNKNAAAVLQGGGALLQNGLHNFQKGWSNVVEGAKKGVAIAQEAVEKEQSRLEFLLAQSRADRPLYFSRDLALPLDVPALKDAEVVYVTDRIISMSHPALPSSPDSHYNITGERKLAAVAHLLEKRHGSGNVMIWNLSEVTNYQDHASAVLERVGPVLAFSFPGSPAPPLGLWLQLLLSLEKWLQASPNNVAVVHCLTGKGRTSTVLAAFLCWMAEAGFEKTNMTMALQYIAQCKKMSVEELTIPSQRRYAQYFTNMLEGIRPSQPPLVLKRIIMSEAPHFALGPPITNNKKTAEGGANDKDDGTQQLGENKDRMGCAPYLQVFQAGQLLHTVAATLNLQQQPDALPFCQVADGSISFHVDQVMQGDVLIRCRHLAHSSRQKISMFRAAFHTGYAPPNVLRFTKLQLDGACNDPRFPDDFFVDLILEPCNEKQAADFYRQQQEAQEKQKQKAMSQEQEAEHEAPENSRISAKKDAVVSASTYDSMLHHDSRFWEVISEHLKDTEASKEQRKSEQEDPAKSRMGPTVGKRRVFASSNPKGGTNEAHTDDKDKAAAHDALQTFSIGNELDFLPEPEKPKPPPVAQPKKDSLMEALLGALGEETARPDTEEIVFENDSNAGSPAPAPEPQPTIATLPPASEVASQPSETSTEKPAESKSATGAVTTEAITTNKVPPPSHQDSAVTTESMKEMENLLGTSASDVLDMDALLADDGDDDFNVDDYNVEDEDAELEDLENFLSQK